jgi:phosphoribosylaminoimidazole (AIR) synthetase
MFRTFNMGIGMIIVCRPNAMSEIRDLTNSYEIGQVVGGGSKTVMIGDAGK